MTQLLRSTVRNYAWGSTSLLAELRGQPATADPEAELWVGAHPGAPSQIIGPEGDSIGLDALIEGDPSGWLGADVSAQFGQLPYLLKLLAAAEPLSLQAHPSKQRAAAGFAAENNAGVPIDAPHRSYKDDNHKPELLCALTPFRAMVGFREVAETADLLRLLDTPALTSIIERLDDAPGGDELRSLLHDLLTMPSTDGAELANAVAAALARVAPGAPFRPEREVASFIAATYPGDPGVVTALLLNTVTLSPGQAIYLDAGLLHAYVDGLGVEIMAASDNVLRGGLTPKHIDVEELLSVLEMVAGPVEVIESVFDDDGRSVWRTPSPDFELTSVRVDGPRQLAAPGPELLVVTSGDVSVSGSSMTPTATAVTRAGSSWQLDGTGTVFIARVPSLE